MEKTKRNILPYIIIVGFLALVVYALGNSIKETEEKNYFDNTKLIANNIVASTDYAIQIRNETIAIWNNCIGKINDEFTDEFTLNENGKFYKDGYDAINNYHNSEHYNKLLEEIQNSRSYTTSNMVKLRDKNVPKKYVILYAELETYYLEYIEVIETPYKYNNDIFEYEQLFNDVYDVFLEKQRLINSYLY